MNPLRSPITKQDVLGWKPSYIWLVSGFFFILITILIFINIKAIKQDETLLTHYSKFEKNLFMEVFEAHKAGVALWEIEKFSVADKSASRIRKEITQLANRINLHLAMTIDHGEQTIKLLTMDDPLNVVERYDKHTNSFSKHLILMADVVNNIMSKEDEVKLLNHIVDLKKIARDLSSLIRQYDDLANQIVSLYFVDIRKDLRERQRLGKMFGFSTIALLIVGVGFGLLTFLILKRNQVALSRAHDDLEAKVDERTSELLMANQRLNETARIASLGYWIRDEVNDKLIDCSEGYARIFGTTKEQMLAQANNVEIYYQFVHPDDRDLAVKKLSKLRANQEPYDVEYRVLRQDDTVCHIREIGNPILDEAGQLVQSSGIIQDITERKQMEQELVHAQKMKAVGQLTGGIAHEFNNLLQAIMGNLHMLRDYPGGEEETAEMLDDAIAASMRGGELTQQLLSFARKQILSPKVIDINDSLSGIFRLLQGTLGENIALETEFAKDLVSVDIDPGSFESAILNLALNARSAMPKGGTMTIETANVSLEEAIPRKDDDLPAGRYVGVTVSDSGCGMPPEVLERAFEPFFTTRDVGQGTGLGLSMVYGFIRQSGGHIAIDSEPGKGTSVRMYLPIAEAEEIEEPDEPENGKVETKESGTILVVEDDPQVRQATVRFLKRIGYEALGAGDGPSALEVLQRHGEVDLVFSDVSMPEDMSGIDLAEEIQRNHKGVKILLNSGYPISEIDRDGTLEDRFILLRKPYSNDQLAAAVKAVMDG